MEETGFVLHGREAVPQNLRGRSGWRPQGKHSLRMTHQDGSPGSQRASESQIRFRALHHLATVTLSYLTSVKFGFSIYNMERIPPGLQDCSRDQSNSTTVSDRV